MNSSFFQGKKITVLGLGLHGGGVGIVKFLVKNGARVIVTDLKTKEELATSLEKLKGLKNVDYVLGQHRTEDFSQVDMVIKNPAVRWDSQHVKLALEKKIPVEMDSSLFFALCSNSIIGVTGTKGKTTTATMIYEILKAVGKSPLKVGISQESVLDKLDLLKKETVVVFELSSWRLSALGRAKRSPQIAVVTNLMPDHLNYYKSMDEYAADKKNIFIFQKPDNWLVINGDDPQLSVMAEEAKAQIIKYSTEPIANGVNIFKRDGALYLNDGIDTKKIIEIEKMNIRAEHNIKNLMAAIGAVFALGVDLEEIKKTVINLKGVPHRLEFIRELKGIKYYNDTAATIPEAAISALNSFSEPIVLIAGGSDKNLEFKEFSKVILGKAKEIILLIGKGTDKLLAELQKDSRFAEKKITVADSMDQAVALASELATPGDIVLLSPGAASFGMFQNEFDRGDKFRNIVAELK